MNAATVARFEESFNQITSNCGIITPDGARSDTALLLKNWLETRHVGPWLMVIDNVDNGNAFFRGKMTVGKSPSECIPHCQNGSLLFTTRSRDVAFDAANPAIPIMIHKLGQAEGLSLVKTRLRQNCSEELIFELLQELEYIPLAITQAIAFMVKRQRTIEQYLRQYRKSDATKTKFLSYEFSEHARPENTLESVAKTWRISFESIRDSNRRAADLLCLINFFQHHGIPAILLQDEDEVEDDFDFEEAVALLKAFSFLNENDSVFSTHRLVQLATRGWLEEEFPEDVDRWAFEALKSIVSHFPKPHTQTEPEYFKLAEILLPHAEIILQHQFRKSTKDSELARAKLLMSSGDCIQWKGNYDESRSRFERAMEINISYLGDKHEQTILSMALLGWAIGQYHEDVRALPILKRVFENKREILGEDDPSTIDTLSALAVVTSLTGNYKESEMMGREALARNERIVGREHNATINCMGHLAAVLDCQGTIEEALKLRQDVYDAKKGLLGNLHPDTLIAEGNLALMLSKFDDTLEEAFSLWRLNLRNTRKIFGPHHVGTLTTAFNFITTLVLCQKRAEARQVCVQCLANADDSLYKDNQHSQKLLEEIKAIWQEYLQTDAGEEMSVSEA